MSRLDGFLAALLSAVAWGLATWGVDKARQHVEKEPPDETDCPCCDGRGTKKLDEVPKGGRK